MGRPLKGSITQAGPDTWRASVPVRRGARKRIERSFRTRAEAEEWVARQTKRLNAGLDADESPTSTALTDPVDLFSDKPPRITNPASLLEQARRWFWGYYIRGQKAGPDRASGVWRDIETKILPYLEELLTWDVAEARRWIFAWVDALAGRPGADGDPQFPGLGGPYAPGTANHFLWALREILISAAVHGADVPMIGDEPAVTHGIGSKRPIGRTQRRPSLVSLWITTKIAAELHVIHQTVLWLMRLAGLRISEVYGLVVGNFTRAEGNVGLLLIEAQGGRRFSEWDADGRIGEVDETYRKTQTKTDAGYRLIALPTLLTDLIVFVIEAFHTDPVTGEIDGEARLIPTIRSEVGGPHGFRAALANACRAVGEGSEDPDAYIPHDLRKAYATDLAWNDELGDLVRRRAMGHRAGSDVFNEVYTLDDRLAESMSKVCNRLNRDLEADGVDTLMIPTAKRPLYGSDTTPSPYTSGRLLDAGWEVDPFDDGWITAAEAALHLDMRETATRRLLPDEIPAVKDDGMWRVRLDDVLAWKNRFDGWTLLTDLAEEAGVTYHQAYTMTRRLEIEPTSDEPSRRILLTDADAQRLLGEFERLERLRSRAMRTGEAAACLGVAHSTVRKWANEGRFEVDPETDATGGRYFTRRSVQAEIDRRGIAVSAVSIEEVAVYANLEIETVTTLVEVGILSGDSERVTLESVRRWAVGYRTDLLSTSLLQRGDASVFTDSR